MGIPEHLFGNLVSQSFIRLHLCYVIVESRLSLLSFLINSVDSEADIQGLLELVIEGLPLLWRHHIQLLVVALNLRVALITLFLDAPIILLSLLA